MSDQHTHEIVLRGRIGRHVLGPFLDDFRIDHVVGADAAGVTRLVGTVRDPSHLHGLVMFLASINAELVSVTPVSTNPVHIHPVHPTSDTRSTS